MITCNNWQLQRHSLLSQVISCGTFRLDSKNLNWFINWQVSQLLQNNTYLHTILASQQLMLRVPEYRAPFYNSTCLDKMLNILSTRISFQVCPISFIFM